MPLIRAFFAIDLPENVQEKIYHVMGDLQKKLPTNLVKWTRPQHLHITLQFMPEVEWDEIQALVGNVRVELAQAKSFVIELDSLALFPTPNQPHLIALQSKSQEQLANLASLIGKGIVATDYPIEDRPFRSHVTLGRFPREHLKSVSLDGVTLPIIEKIKVNEVVFFQSEPSNEGSDYIPLMHVKLQP